MVGLWHAMLAMKIADVELFKEYVAHFTQRMDVLFQVELEEPFQILRLRSHIFEEAKLKALCGRFLPPVAMRKKDHRLLIIRKSVVGFGN